MIRTLGAVPCEVLDHGDGVGDGHGLRLEHVERLVQVLAAHAVIRRPQPTTAHQRDQVVRPAVMRREKGW
jgi:hypothetical protein